MKYLVPFLLLFCAGSAFAKFDWSELEIPVRDGSKLAADFYTNDSRSPKPVILIQTPYNRKLYRLTSQLPAEAGPSFPLDTAAFNYVIVDWRGFYGSKDAPAAGYDRGLDGYDIVEWIAVQEWCNGRIGTWGPSALGAIQFNTARHRPPHLVCAVPLVKDFKIKYSDYYYGGEYRKSHVQALQTLGFFTTALILAHPTNDLFVRTAEATTDYPDEFAVPMLIIGGWFDHYPDDVLRAYKDIAERSDPSVRDRHRLLFGPWTHSGIGQSEQGELEYPNAEGTANEAALRFLHFYLLDADNGWENTPRVRYYQMGENEWKEAESWEGVVDRGIDQEFYLHGNGLLSPDRSGAPAADPDRMTFDPRNPSPTYGGSYFDPLNFDAAVGPYDQREVVESRSDALLYTSEPLADDLVVIGPTVVNLVITPDRYDTDIAVRLCDVYPDGRSMLLTQGIRRLRFRNGFLPADTTLAEPGTEYDVQVELQNLAITFKAGHRVRIIVTGSNYPHFDVNPNTAAPLYDSPDSLVATTLIHTAPSRLSRVTFRTAGLSGAEPTAEGTGTYRMNVSPNPLKDGGRVGFRILDPATVAFDLVDVTGAVRARLGEWDCEPGEHTFPMDLPDDLPSGFYFCRMTVDGAAAGRVPVILTGR